MKPRLLSLVFHLAAVTGCFGVMVGNEVAQGITGSETPETGVVLTKLSSPIYPPLARQARIIGDVRIQIRIRQDGSIESAEVVSGHPMLKQAALESAQKSTFECRRCSEAVTSYSLTYGFEVRKDPDCCTAHPQSTQIEPSRDRIEIIAPELCLCDPAAVRIRVRSAKCLYLWKCGLHVQAVE